MKRIIAAILTLLTVVALTACGSSNDKANAKVQLGTSAISIVLPQGYDEAEDSFDED